MTSFRAAGVAMPSSPNPVYRVSGVAMTAPSGKPSEVARVHVFAFGALPAGAAVAAQPSKPVSNDVVSPVENATSSTNAPSPCTDQSLAYAIEISTCLPAYAPRLIDHCSQPAERPLAAFQTPVVPVGVQEPVPSNVW